MQPRLTKRRAHVRRLSNNRSTRVRESWALSSSQKAERGNSYRHPCPCCESPIITVRMPNGGWAHFEGAEGLERVKHPCMHIGDGLSKKRDDQTLDLFAKQATG
jgi:hypothetical protein